MSQLLFNFLVLDERKKRRKKINVSPVFHQNCELYISLPEYSQAENKRENYGT